MTANPTLTFDISIPVIVESLIASTLPVFWRITVSKVEIPVITVVDAVPKVPSAENIILETDDVVAIPTEPVCVTAKSRNSIGFVDNVEVGTTVIP